MNQLLAFLFAIASFISIIQESETSCEVLVDPEYKGNVVVYDQPNGKIIASLKQDFENEDFLFLRITKQSSDYLYGTLEYPISGKQIKGWVKKSKFIGVYARNYEEGKPLNLFSEPIKFSKVSSTIHNWYNKLYQVTSVSKGWVFVKVELNGKVKHGWLAPDMQCANAYTTCN